MNDFSQFYQDGGVFMHVITLLGIIASVMLVRRVSTIRRTFRDPNEQLMRLRRGDVLTPTLICAAVLCGAEPDGDEAALLRHPTHVAAELGRAAIAVRGVRVRVQRAQIVEAGGAEHRVARRVQDRVAVAVAIGADGRRDLDAGEVAGAALDQSV